MEDYRSKVEAKRIGPQLQPTMSSSRVAVAGRAVNTTSSSWPVVVDMQLLMKSPGSDVIETTSRSMDALNNISSDSTADGEVTSLSMVVAALMSFCIMATIVGNVLVVLSVFTYRPLRAVQNFYIVSLAVADLAVAVLVMPFNVAVSTAADGKWAFGRAWCYVWLTCDILMCTASILNLCAIAVDRYFAVHDPTGYGRRRTVSRVLLTVGLVWIASAIISIPPLPLFGWKSTLSSEVTTGNSTASAPTRSIPVLYDENEQRCQLSDERTYVVYSASGSFFIPLIVMIFVYVNIYAATRARLRARAAADGRLAAIVTTASTLQPEMGQHLTTTAIVVATAAASVVGGSEVIENRQAGIPSSSDGEAEDRDAIQLQQQQQLIQRSSATVTVFPNYAVRQNAINEQLKHAEETVDGSPDVRRKLNEGVNADGGRDCVKSDVVVVCHEGSRRRKFILNPTGNKRHFGSIMRRFTGNESIDAHTTNDISFKTGKNDQKSAAANASKAINSNSCTAAGGGGGGGQIWQFLEEKQRISLARERRAARTMGVVMGAFVLCWLPFFVVYVVFAFCQSCKDSTNDQVYNFIVWLGYINSTLNPLIYTVFNIDFRRAFTLLLRCRCGRRRRHGVHHR